MCVLFAPAVIVSVYCDGCAGTVSVFVLLLSLFVTYIIVITIFIIITHIIIIVGIEKSF